MGYPSFPHYALRRRKAAKPPRKPLSLVTATGLGIAILAAFTAFLLAFG